MKKQRLTEKKWKEICKGCYCPPVYKALGEYANMPEYLRRLCCIDCLDKTKVREAIEKVNEGLRLKYDETAYFDIFTKELGKELGL